MALALLIEDGEVYHIERARRHVRGVTLFLVGGRTTVLPLPPELILPFMFSLTTGTMNPVRITRKPE